MIEIDGQIFAEDIRHFSFPVWHRITNMASLVRLQEFSSLSSASFTGTGLDDIGLSLVCRVSTIDNLNLQDTQITDQGLQALVKLPALKSLRLKENPQLGNACMPFLASIKSLTELQLHETGIDAEGLNLLTGLKQLEDLCLDAENFGPYPTDCRDQLIALSARLPECRILVKGHGEALGGEIIGNWRTY